MNDNLREAQLVMLNLLIEFDKICTQNDLSYWLDFGTLLGAVRYKGFIPWDDDLDVAMPREDYEIFLKIAPVELSDTIFLQTKESDKSFFVHFAKLRDKKSLYIELFEKNKKIKYHQGIYMDIFPVNYIEDKKSSIYLYTFLKYMTKVFSNRYIAFDTIAIPLIKMTTKLHSNNNSFIVRGGEMMTNRLQLDKKEIFPLVKMEFEGYKFNAPKNWSKYLNIFYGDDYMTPPPEDKRKTHAYSIEIFDEK